MFDCYGTDEVKSLRRAYSDVLGKPTGVGDIDAAVAMLERRSARAAVNFRAIVASSARLWCMSSTPHCDWAGCIQEGGARSVAEVSARTKLIFGQPKK
jgi:hypothetical protein